MVVSDDFLLSFFHEATSALMENLDIRAAVNSGNSNSNNSDSRSSESSYFSLADCRRYILDRQREVLTTQILRQHHEDATVTSNSMMVHSTRRTTFTQAQERLGRLPAEPNLSPKLKLAMDDMNEAARLALCKLVLYSEESFACTSKSRSSTAIASSGSDSKRDLQCRGSLERNKLLEYFALCQTALRLHCVKKFMAEGGALFDDLPSTMTVPRSERERISMMFPQSRLEHVQRQLAKSMGWDPDFVTQELQRIFVQKDDTIDFVHDQEVNIVFQQLVGQMEAAIRTASLQMSQHQTTSSSAMANTAMLAPSLSDGSTRVVSVRYTEFEITPDGTEYRGVAPERQSTVDTQLSEDEQKRQIRLASEATLLQQEILGELLDMGEDDRRGRLEEAAKVSEDFMNRVMALPPGRERIDFLMSVDLTTSKQLAMHKLWSSMLQSNGGQPPIRSTTDQIEIPMPP
jgi:hypothetical protein